MGVVVTTDGAAEPLPFDVDALADGTVVVDLVYHPRGHPARARRPGPEACTRSTAWGCSIHQAAHAFRLWTGEAPPLEAMSAAAVAGLAERLSGPT